MKNPNIFLIPTLCVGLFFASSCSGGVLIPKPVCEYGALICETLYSLCDNPTNTDLTSAQVEDLEKAMRDFYKVLQTFQPKTTGK